VEIAASEFGLSPSWMKHRSRHPSTRGPSRRPLPSSISTTALRWAAKTPAATQGQASQPDVMTDSVVHPAVPELPVRADYGACVLHSPDGQAIILRCC
jgi:hypothetical protein